MADKLTQYLTRCQSCDANTSKKFAREHDGRCKACVTGVAKPTRNERILDAGWQAYAREEGHYDS